MNKDVLYVKSDDDMRTIAGKIRSLAKKIVAIVPPATSPELFYSSANLKMLMRVAAAADKIVVVITEDPAIIRAAVSARLPLSASLHSKPYLPTLDNINTISDDATEEEPSASEKVSDDPTLSASDTFTSAPTPAEKIFEKPETKIAVEEEPAEDEAEEPEEEKTEPDEDRLKVADRKVDRAEKKLKNEDRREERKRRKKIILISLVAVSIVGLLVLLLVWAFVVAPAVDIAITIKTTSANFAENVSFVNEASAEEPEAGKFYLDPLTYSETKEATFEATGKKDVGDYARGSLTLYYTFRANSAKEFTVGTTIGIPAGSTFSQDGKNYYTDADAEIKHNVDDCPVDSKFLSDGCTQSVTVRISAADIGETYNANANAIWTSGVTDITAKNPEAITGGYAKTITVLSQSDVDRATEALAPSSKSDILPLLEDGMKKGYIKIEDSYSYEAGEIELSQKVDEEVKDGEKVTAKRKFDYKINTLESAALEKFVVASVKDLGADQKIYAVTTPFIQRYIVSDNGITGRLSATYKYGPEVTSDQVLEMAKGQKIGDLRSRLKSVNGVDTVTISPSFPWVTSVPNDSNKITVNIEVKEQ